ncbi:mannose-1-phosphate guanylyltransferase [Pseudoglutamicibacter cumminsii]|uniref:Mannose-1-phosphate guanylyltransferase n=1 Tax=Pseudoglutamicibacter cumminsii TaxID=156979 RepID=A0ABX5L591_9MICC|nr:mannose-1-phosphate guanylyltransferase [Pseudoglutamicibacter cumminsii]PWI27908.1 mannose-1-phosphate guanylyltransferase [Pseudoglutamicibacter cumminsii]
MMNDGVSDDVMKRFYGVIPAGGTGTRLWPLSRAAAPKFLHDLTGCGSTLIRSTYERLLPLTNERVLVVTGQAHGEAVRRQITELREHDLVLEPEPKDSAAAIGLTAAILNKFNPDIIMGSFAADQVITPEAQFRDAVVEAVHVAATGKIVTIGITPTYAATGFGYIRAGKKLIIPGAPNGRAVIDFVEKPGEDAAQRYLASGNYLWNAGMFVAPVGLMLKHLRKNEPALAAGLEEIADAWGTDRQQQVMNDVWPGLPKTAIDYAVAEPAAAAGDVAVVPGEFTWDDVGDFAALGRLNPAEDDSRVRVLGHGGRVYVDESSGIVVSDTNRVIALIGVEDVVVVDTPDALLVTTKSHAQQVKDAVNALKAHGQTDVL